jgi:hypothetical protein
LRGDKRKITIRIFDGDLERAQRFYPHLNYNLVFRNIIHKHLDIAEEKFNQLISKPSLKAPKLDTSFIKAGDSE